MSISAEEFFCTVSNFSTLETDTLQRVLAGGGGEGGSKKEKSFFCSVGEDVMLKESWSMARG